MIHFAVTWLVTTVGLLLLAQLPFGLEIQGVGTAAFAALLLGGLDLFLGPLLLYLSASFQWLTVDLFAIGLNGLFFWLTSTLLDGFRLRAGIVSALINPVALTLLNSWILWLLH